MPKKTIRANRYGQTDGRDYPVNLNLCVKKLKLNMGRTHRRTDGPSIIIEKLRFQQVH